MNPRPLQPKCIRRNISGVLLLDKPCGISSNRALQIIKRIFAASKAGHTGTLDPMATGLLPICLGEATKFSSALLGADKTYEAVLRLGYISTTGDAEGEISVAGDMKLTLLQVEAVLQSFIGIVTQIPPMYSALKHQGKPLYIYARKGVEIERQPREITIHDLRIETLTGDEMCEGTSVLARDLWGIQPGDVLLLHHPVGARITGLLNGKPRYWGYLARAGPRLAYEIVSDFDPDRPT